MMVLYSGTTCPFSQRCRLVLFEKGMDFEVRDVDLFNKPEDISTRTRTARCRSWSNAS
jgi:stringent starvation protein A